MKTFIIAIALTLCPMVVVAESSREIDPIELIRQRQLVELNRELIEEAKERRYYNNVGRHTENMFPHSSASREESTGSYSNLAAIILNSSRERK